MQVQCCVCYALKKGQLWIPHKEKLFNCSHGYCPICFKKTYKEIEEYKMRTKREYKKEAIKTKPIEEQEGTDLISYTFHNIPRRLKNDFKVMCHINDTSMTETIVEFMLSYLKVNAENYKRHKSRYACIPDDMRKDQDTDIDMLNEQLRDEL